MRVLAEGIRRIFPRQELPFEERWENARKLPKEKQVAFLAREILDLISQAERPIVTIFSRTDLVVALPFTPQQVEESSSLPTEIKDFLSTFPLVKKESVIWLFESSPRSLAIPVVSVGLLITIQRKPTFGIEVFGRQTLFRSNFEVGRARVVLPGSLREFGEKVGEIQVAKGLISFARELIHQKQQLGTTPK